MFSSSLLDCIHHCSEIPLQCRPFATSWFSGIRIREQSVLRSTSRARGGGRGTTVVGVETELGVNFLEPCLGSSAEPWIVRKDPRYTYVSRPWEHGKQRWTAPSHFVFVGRTGFVPLHVVIRPAIASSKRDFDHGLQHPRPDHAHPRTNAHPSPNPTTTTPKPLFHHAFRHTKLFVVVFLSERRGICVAG